MPAPPFVVRPVNWGATRDKLRALRRKVFIEEQNVPEELEWDGADETAYHVLATSEEGEPIGTGRLMLTGQIGRMAVARNWRRCGVGGAVLQSLLELARKEGCMTVHLHAQTHAIAFYSKYGFIAVGEEFDEAGIPHRMMELKLGPEPAARG
jgi:predicted GNAT family N-acyltransferase